MEFKYWLQLKEAGEFVGHGEPTPEPRVSPLTYRKLAPAMQDYNSSELPPTRKNQNPKVKRANKVKFT
jgi:hypothetical protein